jgi:hypothetical protein
MCEPSAITSTAGKVPVARPEADADGKNVQGPAAAQALRASWRWKSDSMMKRETSLCLPYNP